MNAKEKARLNSYKALADFFNTYEADLEIVSSSKDIIRVFRAVHKDILQQEIDFNRETKPVSSVKQQHDLLVRKLDSFCNSFNVWQQLNDQPPKADFSLTASAIRQKTYDSLVAFTGSIIKQYTHLSEKPDHSILESHALEDLKNTLEEFIKTRSLSGEYSSKKLHLKEQLRESIRRMELHLLKSDALLRLFKTKNPLLFIAYVEARRKKEKTYEAKPLFSDIVHPNSTRTISTIHYQGNAWLVIQNKSQVNLSVHLSLLRDIALGEGLAVPPESTIYRQVKNLHADPEARYIIVKNEHKTDSGILEIRMG